MAGPRTLLTVEQLRAGHAPEGLIQNSAFMPADQAASSRHELNHILTVRPAPMASNYTALSDRLYNGRRADLFPGFSVQICSDGDTLTFADRGLLWSADASCYWQIVLSPGLVWSEPADGGLSRAVIPFQLCNVLENDTHHGLAGFCFDRSAVSHVRFQICTATKGFIVPDSFDAWGIAEANLEPATHPPVEAGDRRHPLKPWKELPGQVPRNLIDEVANGRCSGTEVVSGLVIDDVIYATDCATRAGPFPLPQAMTFGIWSATKTAFGTVACMRLAQITGEDPRKARLADLLPEGEGLDRWSGITIGHCLNMATGIGTAAPHVEGTTIMSDYLLSEDEAGLSDEARRSYEHYYAWFLAPSQSEKNRAAFACEAYPWGPDEVARYRDQDLYIAGAAMQAWYRRTCGAGKRLWHLVRDEVYAPCGIHHAVKFETIEDDPARIVPLTDAGLLVSMDDIANLTRLLHRRGALAGEQILDPAILCEVFDPKTVKGLPTGRHTADGECRYSCGTWHMPYRARSGTFHWLPTMVGYGGQMIQLLPHGMTAFRFGHDPEGGEDGYDTLRLARIADAVRAF